MAPSNDDSDFDADSSACIRARVSDGIGVQKASSCPSLPNEIWYNIWHLLPLDDRLAVARVCTAWRRVAHAQRSLWNQLDFRTSVHQRNCLCKMCNNLGDESDSSDPDAEDWPWNVSNLHHASRVLPLSGNLDLHITLEVQACDASLDDLYALGVAMLDHADRIATLTIRTADTAAYYTFLARVESLPVLRSFSGVLMGNRGRRPYGASFVPAAVQVPLLQTVRLSRGFCFPTRQIGRTFPTVRDISIAPAMSISAEVLHALGACPNLESFALDLHSFARPGPSDDTTTVVQQRAPAMRSVAVSGIRLEFEQWVLAALTHSALQTVTLEYDSPHNISLGWSIFTSLTVPLTLRVSMKNHWPDCVHPTSDSVFCFQVEDSNGRTRRIALHHCASDKAQTALAHLSAILPHKIVAPYALCPLVHEALDLRALNAVTLVVSTHDVEDQTALAAEDGELSLRALTLIYDGSGTLSLSPAQVEQLVRRMRPRLPLDLLTLDRRLAASVQNASLARRLFVGACSVPEFPMPEPLRDEQRCESEPASEDSDLEESD